MYQMILLFNEKNKYSYDKQCVQSTDTHGKHDNNSKTMDKAGTFTSKAHQQSDMCK